MSFIGATGPPGLRGSDGKDGQSGEDGRVGEKGSKGEPGVFRERFSLNAIFFCFLLLFSM